MLEVIGLNLGCGRDIYTSTDTSVIKWINIDCEDLEGVDMLLNLNDFPYPFEDNSVGMIVLNDVLEHLDDPIEVIRECYRLLKKGGWLKIRVLYWNHIYNYSDPQHKHVFAPRYFEMFTKETNRPYYFDFYFESIEIGYTFDEKAIEKYGNNKELLMEKSYFHCNIIDGMHIKLVK